MISKRSKKECYVYVTLPGQTQSVTAGLLRLDSDRSGNTVGQFVYGKTYLARNDSVEIDPVELKLGTATYKSPKFQGVFNSLRDAGPDYWGRQLIEKYSGKTNLDEIDYLLESPDDRAGALGFGLNQEPPAPLRKFNNTLQLEKLQSIAHRLIEEQVMETDFATVQTKDILLIGTSMGGARPKAVVEDESGLWVAKFSRPDDRWNNPRVEHAMLELARICKINSARSRLEKIGGKDVLLVHRFDRKKSKSGYLRARMISALTLLGADESPMNRERWSYVLLAEEIRRVVEDPKKDSLELFRRMCFNALISNNDDHPRNHACISFARNWHLAPAYDLTPSLAVSLEHRDLAMACGDMGRFANAKNLLSQRSRFLLDESQAQLIVEEMTNEIQLNWRKVCRAHGVTVRDLEAIQGAFVYEGFGV